MFGSFTTYGGLSGLINTLETEQDVRIFLSKYKKWYVTERHLSKTQAEDKIKLDIRYCMEKFDMKDNLARLFSQILDISFFRDSRIS